MVKRTNIRNEKGVTLIALMITVIVLTIITAIVLKEGKFGTREVKDEMLETELQMVNHAVLERYTKWNITKNDSVLIGTEIETSESVQQILTQTTSYENVKIVYDSADGIPKQNLYYELAEEELKQIGITSAKYTYVVNYRTGEVINKTILKTSEGKPLYISGIDVAMDNGRQEVLIREGNNFKSEYLSDEDVNYQDLYIDVITDQGKEILDASNYVISCEKNTDNSNNIRHVITVKYDDENIFTVETYKKGWYGEKSGKRYYYKDKNKISGTTIQIEGKEYTFDVNGVCTNP